MPDYTIGDTVRYKPIGGESPPSAILILSNHQHTKTHKNPGPDSKTAEAIGTVREVRTHPGTMTGRNVEASDEMPRDEVRTSHAYISLYTWVSADVG